MSSNLPRSAPPRPDAGRYTRLPDALISTLTPREHQLVHALLSYRWTDDAPIYPSVRTLARQMACSERTVQRTAARLVERGYIVVEARYRADEGQTSNLYQPGPLLAPLLASTRDADDARPGQTWHRGASAVAGKRDSGNQANRTRRPERGYVHPAHVDPAAYTGGELSRQYVRT